MAYVPTCGNKKCEHSEAMHLANFIDRPDPTTGESLTVAVRPCTGIGCRCPDYREAGD